MDVSSSSQNESSSLRTLMGFVIRHSSFGIVTAPWLALARRHRFRPGAYWLTLVMCMHAAQEWHLVEHVLLEPFEPEIDHWCDEQCDQLRENQTAYDYQP